MRYNLSSESVCVHCGFSIFVIRYNALGEEMWAHSESNSLACLDRLDTSAEPE